MGASRPTAATKLLSHLCRTMMKMAMRSLATMLLLLRRSASGSSRGMRASNAAWPKQSVMASTLLVTAALLADRVYLRCAFRRHHEDAIAAAEAGLEGK